MVRFSRLLCVSAALAVLASLVACQGRAPPAAVVAPPTPAAHDTFNRLVDRYWDEHAALNPFYPAAELGLRLGNSPGNPIDEQYLADSLALERRYLAELVTIPRGSLDAEASVSYDIFQRERELAARSFTFPVELMPLNPFDGLPQRFSLLASGAAPYPLTSEQDYVRWQTLTEAFVKWSKQAIVNMRAGMRRGYTAPRAEVERLLPQLAALGNDAPQSIFYAPVRTLPAAYANAVGSGVHDKILPAYRELHDFLQNEYLPRARDSIGLQALPLGEAWYAFSVRRYTGAEQPAAALHALAVSQVERLRTRMQSVLSEAAFAGSPQNFLEVMRRDPRFGYADAEPLLAAYAELKTQIAATLPALFASTVPSDVDIRAVDASREGIATAVSVEFAPAYGRSSAVLYVNTGNLTARPATALGAQYLRAAAPGRLFQRGIQEERGDLPRFRRFGDTPAFTEGWALYAVTLGEELGTYRDSESKFGALLLQLDCAAGAVIDSGIHGLGWSRPQALDYLRAHTPFDDAASATLIDRAGALPGEALACLVGEAKLQALKLRAQQVLGSRFELAAFHSEVLKDGAMPLDLLEAKMLRWIEALPKAD